MPYFDNQFSLITGYRFLLKDIIGFLYSVDSFAPSEGAKLLDAGCGDRPYRRLFRKYAYLGMDLHPEVSSPDVLGSILDIPFPDASFDAALTVWVLDDIPEPGDGIGEISRILKPGGYYFAVEAQSTNRHFRPNDYFRFAPAALIHLCRKQGLEVVKVGAYGGDFAHIGFSIITLFNTVFDRMLGKYNFLKPIYSLVVNLLFFPFDRLSRCRIFGEFFERNAPGYCYVFIKTSSS